MKKQKKIIGKVGGEAKTWHEKHAKNSTLGQRVADGTANLMGSWRFIIIQTVFVILWMSLNCLAYISHWDVYPFILLNLIFSTQAAYAAPIIMMAQNRQNERDRYQAKEDYFTNVQAKKEIEELQKSLARIENDKLDKILKILDK
ncbi:MAG: DUF1003 domain-containing protein [Candidatus Falkowbacteria bacterium]|nr:DUF1003 domain-containing protein [Candidatus Falkowbacteria bacterium]